MAVINWPTGATPGDIYVSPEGDRWVWNGSAWDGISGAANIGPQGPQGAATGPQGSFGPQGPIGPNPSSYDVLLMTQFSGYESDSFWFNWSSFNSFFTTGGTMTLSVESLMVDNVEYISSVTGVDVTSSDSWFYYGGTVSGPEFSTKVFIADYGATGSSSAGAQIPVKWLCHLDSLGDSPGVCFSGVKAFAYNNIALKNDLDFKIVIKRKAPGELDQDDYWYKWEYSSSTKLATITYSGSGATGPWSTLGIGGSVVAIPGPFYK